MPLRRMLGGGPLAATAFLVVPFLVVPVLVVSCAFSGRAQAGDLPPAAPLAYPPRVYDWTGIYVGGHVDGGFAGASLSDPIDVGGDRREETGDGQTDFSWINLRTGPGGETTSTATGRIGAAFARLLAYAAGGQSGLSGDAGDSASESVPRTGWIAGAGLGYALTGSASAAVEYDYRGFGPQPMNFAAPAALAGVGAGLATPNLAAGPNIRVAGRQ